MGLVTEARNDIDPDVAPFARKVEELGSQGLAEGSKLTEVNTGSWRSWSRGY